VSFVAGDEGESIWVSYLERTGRFSDIEVSEGEFHDWDIKSTNLASGESVTYEVKLDLKAYMWAKWRKSKYPNMYIEYHNTRQDKPSGIMTSKSDYYVYIIRNEGANECYVFETGTLRGYLKGAGLKSVGNKSNGDDNAMGWLLPVNTIGQSMGYLGRLNL